MTSKKTRDRLGAVAIIAIILLLVVNAYLMYDKFNQDKIIEKQKKELKEANSLKNDLEEEYYEALSELEDMKTDNEELNQLIEEQKGKLKDQKDQIDRLLIDKRDLAQARKRLDDLKENVDQYITEIERLHEENRQLSEKNQSLSQQNRQLSDQVTKEQAEKKELELERQSLLSDQAQMESKQKEMEEKIDRASVIQVKELDVQGFKVANSGKLRKRRKARNIDLVKICFTTTANPVADAGEEDFYVRIINPIGETIAVEALGSGVIESQKNREMIRYTQFTSISYEQKPKEICVDWKAATPFMEGLYEIEVYNKGFRAGKTTFEMR
jgi:predicted  nucleic acid-binding Zn-ribbon protein